MPLHPLSIKLHFRSQLLSPPARVSSPPHSQLLQQFDVCRPICTSDYAPRFAIKHHIIHARKNATITESDAKGRIKEDVGTSNSSSQLAPWARPGYNGAFISAQDETKQQIALVLMSAFIASGTVLLCQNLNLVAFGRPTWPLIGVTYVLAGFAHFSAEDGFLAMFPHPGAWGIWNIPGSAKFHVRWTGIAEIVGGFGLVLGSYIPAAYNMLPWLAPVSASGLLALTVLVTPANMYMVTHNAPGPGPADAVIPPGGHLARGILQILLLSFLWGLATGYS